MDREERLRAALADRYRIEGEIGSGGMATVYLAQDLKHKRQVAVKVLDPELAESLGAERFLREIETAAKLTHPHILPLHDSGKAGGLLYYVMPYVKGESLRRRLERERQLPVEEAVQIAREIADALAYAHREGVIHRDVKPANIMLEEGHAVLADFGVAQAVAEAKDERMTRTGVSLGTPAYMSPEQATGRRDLDGRTDEYALGCVLFEMLAGYPPFMGVEVEAVVRQHVAAEPPLVTQARPSVPVEVERVIRRALAKSPADRFRTTGEMAAALGGTAPTTALRKGRGRTRSAIYAAAVILGLATVARFAFSPFLSGPELVRDRVLVIPLSNATGDPSLDDYAQYATFLIASGLEQTGIVSVVSPEPVFESWEVYSERRRREPGFDSRRAMAREFGAGILVEGSVLPGSDSLRIRVAYRESERQADLPALDPVSVPIEGREEGAGIENVVVSLSAALDQHLDHEWGPTFSRHFSPPPSLPMWREMQAASRAYYRRDLSECLRHIEAAVALDPTYLPVKVREVVALINMDRYPAADSILKRVEPFSDELLQGELTQAQWARATMEGDREGAYRAVKEGNVGHPEWIRGWGFEALRSRRPKEALEVLTKRVDPYAPGTRTVPQYWVNLTEVRHVLEQHRQELKEAKRGRELHPEDQGVFRAELRAQAALGHVQEVEDLLDEAVNKGLGQARRAFWLAPRELRAHQYREASVRIAEAGLAYLNARPTAESETRLHRSYLLDALYMLERWDDAQEVAEDLFREDSTDVRSFGFLGLLAARRGDRPEAERIGREIASMEIPYDRGNSTYLRACIAAILGDRELAVSLLRQAHAEGLWYSVDLHIDFDLDSLQDYAPFQEFMRPRR